jgi:predicted Rossmann fold nucleotide-binding protein DprA/Smf involved in DNA uptake
MTATTKALPQSTKVAVGESARRVLELLRMRCNAAGVAELARATGLDELQVIDALYALEQRGRVTPTVWRLAGLGHDD